MSGYDSLTDENIENEFPFEYEGRDCVILRVMNYTEKEEEDPDIVTTGYKYEFKAYVDGEFVTTATELESNGIDRGDGWIPTLKSYLREKIDEGEY